MPGHIVIIRPQKDSDNHIELEESKAEFDLKTALVIEWENFEESTQSKLESLENELLGRNDVLKN